MNIINTKQKKTKNKQKIQRSRASHALGKLKMNIDKRFFF